MHPLYRAFAVVLLLIAITTIHIGLSFLLPDPWNKINIIFALMALFIVIIESPVSVWMVLIIHFIIELYTTIPFGIQLYAATISALCGYWLYRRIFTNTSWYSALALTAVMLLLYRLFYILLLALVAAASAFTLPPMGDMMRIFFWEILLTTVITFFLYWLVYAIGKKYMRFAS